MTQTRRKDTPEFTVVIERIFDAPREKVWEAWTEKDKVMQWLSPEGFTVSEHKGKVAEGESHSHCMLSPHREESRYAGEYLEVIELEKLVFTHTWTTAVCGETGIETVCTVLLEDVEKGSTKMTFTQAGVRSIKARDSQNGGWNSCFDGLAVFLRAR